MVAKRGRPDIFGAAKIEAAKHSETSYLIFGEMLDMTVMTHMADMTDMTDMADMTDMTHLSHMADMIDIWLI